MQNVKIEPFKVIGISVRTTNENGQSAQDIGQLWARFMSEKIGEQVPNKSSEDVYCVYTNFEKDHTKPYDTILGFRVNTLESIPEGMAGHTIEGGTFSQYLSKGDLTQGKAVYETWAEIWQTDLDRTFTSDFEVYGEKAQNPTDAEVDVFVAVNA